MYANDHPITQAEMNVLLHEYISGFYQILGGIAAIVIIGLAFYFIINPFLKRLP